LFFETYQDKSKRKLFAGEPRSKNVLDRWIVSRLGNLAQDVSLKFEKYDVTGAARAIESFVIEDLSQWYIRRSRKRLQKPETKKELREATQTLSFVLSNLSKLMAPFVPFLSEEVSQRLGGKKSVHLENWPKANKKLIDNKLEKKMAQVREVVNLGLKERAEMGIRVRQPLASLEIPKSKLQISKKLVDLIKEEINVKRIVFGKTLKLDTKITSELKEEGIVREFVRNIQEMRKKAGFRPEDKILVSYFGTPDLNKVLNRNKKNILKEAKIKDLILGEKPKQVFDVEREIKVSQQSLWLGVRKV
jgi:isoleucyl-tRNA synthetase